MTGSPAQPLIDHRPTREFFIGVDSDGCAFDTMEIKHKECFAPNIITFFGLQAISKFAREACEFVNLYSKWRGVNRFPAVLKALDLLEERAEVRERGFAVPRMPAMREWIGREPQPSNPALEAAIEVRAGDAREELELVLAWSRAVNAAIAAMVKGVPPFPWVRELLDKAHAHADMIVVSATPCEALQREWIEHELASFVSIIAGQEMGKKAEHLRLATAGKYPPERVLMIGDAPGDLKAARANGVLFYPIVPGAEEESWRRLHDEMLDRFLANEYGGACETELVDKAELRRTIELPDDGLRTAASPVRIRVALPEPVGPEEPNTHRAAPDRERPH